MHAMVRHALLVHRLGSPGLTPAMSVLRPYNYDPASLPLPGLRPLRVRDPWVTAPGRDVAIRNAAFALDRGPPDEPALS